MSQLCFDAAYTVRELTRTKQKIDITQILRHVVQTISEELTTSWTISVILSLFKDRRWIVS
jgi:hypothetical protein